MTAVLYHWPAAAKFGRVVPKNKFYEHGSVSTALREKFITEAQRITWTYKLAETTLNLPGSADVPEIQIFQIDGKGDDVSEAVLAAIDKTVQTPIIFEIARNDGRIRMTATHKQLGSKVPKLGSYYTTGWQPEDAERQPLPTAITLPTLYAALLQPLSGVSARAGEELSEVSARLAAARKLEREIAALERKLRNEPQLNRKVELRRTLKIKQAELEQQR
ncbi:DUF4391 domain-containing protein [Mycobacteroides abscessus]|uniref:DUF4391 domain-containing protein n=1 Tax=Mycobacteroides abscessus TaxID=36809 RepID=UPI000928FDAE|nr:DUF4391 domain-containing protein [Mycobacteroides abscessus]SHW69589.1 Uncharacterised protein [Mycobacteroides abscessus subsp. abscessus]SIA85820.1 Uncharacterised protein [Mycobacteroides abscessus subsp. abscessus]SKR84468.1 Uncharacterised protein [Mycobacteroides abscessus subsp. abscessus]